MIKTTSRTSHFTGPTSYSLLVVSKAYRHRTLASLETQTEEYLTETGAFTTAKYPNNPQQPPPTALPGRRPLFLLRLSKTQLLVFKTPFETLQPTRTTKPLGRASVPKENSYLQQETVSEVVFFCLQAAIFPWFTPL